MKLRLNTLIIIIVIAIANAACFAADEPETKPASRKKATPIKKAASKPAQKKKTNLVDINGASKEQLKKLTGINDSAADKIIAGRPYGSKADLVTKKIVPPDVYNGIAHAITIKLPYKDSAKNLQYIKEAEKNKKK